MSVHDLKYSVAEFCHLAGIDSVRLRDWRRRGFLNSVGAQVGDKWVYSMRDVCVLKVSQLLRDNGMEIGKSIWLSFASMAFVLDRSQGGGPRFLLLSQWEDDSKRRLLTGLTLAEVQGQIEAHGVVPVMDLVDLHAVIELLPQYLNEVIEAAAD